MHQRSLFPDGFELLQEALQQLQQFRPHEAQATLQRAMRIDAGLPNLAALAGAIEWILARWSPSVASPDAQWLWQSFAALTAAQQQRELDADTAGMVERVLARGLLATLPPDAVFADPACRTPVGVLRQCAGGAAMQQDRLALAAALAAPAFAERADLWAYHGDLCWCQERREEANRSYVRALLLGPGEIDVVHLRYPALRELGLLLRTEWGDPGASRWFVEAVLAGLLQVPPHNDWLRREQIELLQELAPDPWARFAILCYEDLSRGEEGDMLDRRAALQELLPAVFARLMDWRQRGGGSGR